MGPYRGGQAECLRVPFADFNCLKFGMGQAPVKKYVYLRDKIIHGRAKPSFIVSHRLPLSKAPEAYSRFAWRGVGEGKDMTKVVLKPAMDKVV